MIRFIRTSFRRELLFCFIIVAILPLILCNTFMIRSFQLKIQNDYKKEASKQLNQLNALVNNYVSSLDKVSKELCTNENVIKTLYIKDTEQRKGTYLELYTLTAGLRDHAQFSLFSIGGICKYATDNTVIGTQIPTYWGVLKEAKERKGLLVLQSYKNYTSASDIVLQAAKAITDEHNNIVGYLLIEIDDSMFSTMLKEVSNSAESVMVLDPYWQPIYTSDSKLTDTIVPEFRKRLLRNESINIVENKSRYYVSRMDATGFFIVLGQREIFTSSITKTMYSICIIIAVISLLFCTIVAFILSHNLTKPIHNLATAMHEVEKGDLTVRISCDRTDEFEDLFSNFNTMTREISDYVIEQICQQKELDEANIARMQAQLNPHFLYNTLDTIKWVAKANHIPEIATISSCLAKILRTSISENQLIHLKDEMTLVKSYVDIQRIRFSEKFDYEAVVSQKLNDCIVPKLILQPLVENAIIHGLAEQDSGHISICAASIEEELVITVIDDGCGIDEAMLEQLNSHNKNNLEGHLGFYNVDTIIRLHYGKKYGLKITSDDHKGTVVTVCLPIQYEEKSSNGGEADA